MRHRTRAVSHATPASDPAEGGKELTKTPGKQSVQGQARQRRSSTAVAAAAQAPEHEAPVQKQTHKRRGRKGAAKQSSDEEREGGSAVGKRGKRQRREVVVPEPEVRCFSLAQQAVRVGTSGYSYAHWRGPEGFYGGLPQRLEFQRYAKEFDTVELNATFYGWFEEGTYDWWRDKAAAARPSFEYVVKAPQLYSHRKRLNVDDGFRESWGRFWERCQRLRPHLGPILFQFPATFKTTSSKGAAVTSNVDRLRALGELLPRGEKFVFEFRDASWLCQEVYAVLRQHDWALAIAHLTDAPGAVKLPRGGWIGSLQPGPNPPPEAYPLGACSWGVYVRFHGAEGQYCGSHGAAELRRWAARAKEWAAGGRRVYFLFNNDAVQDGEALPSAILDCRTLAAELRANGTWPD